MAHGLNRVVVHFRDGRVLKGSTFDFTPQRPAFHLVTEQPGGQKTTHEIQSKNLKAVFFVKTFEGKKDYVEKKGFGQPGTSPAVGLKLKITFDDGEVITGTSPGYSQNREGFFISPIDPNSNNDRIFVLSGAVTDVKVGAAAEQ